MQVFKINKNLEVVCQSENTRYGFRHIATLQRNGWEKIGFAKVCYYNRTWESYEFESVLGKLADTKDLFSNSELKTFNRKIKNQFRKDDPALKNLKTIAGIAKLGEIFGQTQTEKNDWKTRILKAGLENKGLIIPDDWETLDENTKQIRLNKVIATLS